MPKKTDTVSLPSGWPMDIIYITSQKYAAELPFKLKQRVGGVEGSKTEGSKSAWVAIQVISAPSHPANGQRGLFATRKIPPKTHILDYLGEVHADDRDDSDYDLSLLRLSTSEAVSMGVSDEPISIGLDAQQMGNEARFCNDYRGIAESPNAEFKDHLVGDELRIGVFSGPKGVGKGKEILVSYGKGWWKARNEDWGGV
ncbi:hypothetical protein FRB96_003496 [Tulasnella sp. 330]|nr:hypothetical protein FRB96_003496 [Tulasnella sp. 330]KAG8885501.1 hypothetical protein FRB97_000826 [Tulasnella sp. 331]KAG8890307.1 hypothetical protein FRB98_009375 [Tulasnella sp. 332]